MQTVEMEERMRHNFDELIKKTKKSLMELIEEIEI